MLTQAEENYLKVIYHLSLTEDEGISTNAIAQKIDTKASSVTDMIKKLNDKNLIRHEKYKGVFMTAEGLYKAKMIIRKHRLWEVFLVEKLEFNWDEVHDVAEELEHIKSEKLINALDAFLGFPKEDPHGDPIPNAVGEIPYRQKELLSETEINQEYMCVGVKDTSSSFLQYLDRQKIALGSTFKVVKHESFDHSITILFQNLELTLSKVVTQNIYVKKV
ncbi:metal-dependent transcriptional regulator [Flavobacterium sp. xlx-214]|uniref:metal-dependent transcriptional regulator n=1 Tax=unclassified Flavobacterium TaxID=196869 RepID=UPI0013D3172B|nr:MULTISPECIES: metal-dependent transcriptional regulator [unclassified Flavobacterium]MBA5793661.1 metal-dependent transcriptional regulator [Flavobacterium sp. xlx-221]QMI84587.1 metal-dependent transcriptional regulator [Flavobacterium sp. xlx-214]